MQQYTHEYIKSIPHLPVYCLLYETYRQMSPSHWHDHLEIIYVLEGELQISSNENADIYANDGHILHEELLVTEDSITDILERNGFTNYKVFSRMFKTQFGMTPRELRRLRHYS